MAEWLYEAGIGEARAALVEGARLLAAAIEPAGTLTVGTVARGRLIERRARGEARVALADGTEVDARLPAAMPEGAAVTVAIAREAIPERGRPKPPRAVASDAAPAPGPDLLARCRASGHPVRVLLPHQPDTLEAAGWSETLEEATSGTIAFPGGALRMSVTPAMTLFDVDGHLDSLPLALAAADAVAAAIVRHGIGGSIGVDFPTLADRAGRQAVAAALDAALARDDRVGGAPTPFERTAVNGFGFLQIVRPRPRASLPERLLADPPRAAATALLRRIEREPPGGPTVHPAPAEVHRYLAARPEWLAELARRTGVEHRVEPSR